ncbi:MAG: transcriptional regulator [Marinilabiliaceae bacterium]|nr:transcriptional regulator [Marinilabiliaceae bacterium]
MQEKRQEKSLIKQNILKYLKYRGASSYEFYKDSGVTRGILQQDNGISEENLHKFLLYAPNISTEWLLTGIGSMFKKDVSEDMSNRDIMTKSVSDIEQKSQDNLSDNNINTDCSQVFIQLTDTISKLANENGRLQERITHLEETLTELKSKSIK